VNVAALRRVVVACLCSGLLLTVGSAQRPQPQNPATFRARTDVVSVDVLVRDRSKPVPGLTAADFRLTDSGVPQEVEVLAAEEVPIDLTLVLDVSGSVTRLLEEFKDNIRQIAKLLRPVDRIRLISFSNSVQLVFPFSAPSTKLPLDRLSGAGGTALDDALLFAMAHAPESGRRHLVVAFTDGGENASIMNPLMLTDAAARADALVHMVISSAGTITVTQIQAGAASITSAPVTQTFGPITTDMLLAPLQVMAEATGGELHISQKSSKLVDGFKVVFQTFRSGYLLRYSPRGVQMSGWHDIHVEVTRPGRFEVLARKGYPGS
jgi:VWFA-related protein